MLDLDAWARQAGPVASHALQPNSRCPCWRVGVLQEDAGAALVIANDPSDKNLAGDVDGWPSPQLLRL